MTRCEAIVTSDHSDRVRRLNDLLDHGLRVVFQWARDDDKAGEREIAFILFSTACTDLDTLK